jgi:anti-sigma B factor antagonist
VSTADQLSVPVPPFRVDVHPEREAVRVAPVGELDLTTAGLLETQLHDLRTAGFERVVLDLRELTFIDSSGIRVIVAENRHAQATEREFSLLPGPPAVQRALEICGLLGLLHVDGA